MNNWARVLQHAKRRVNSHDFATWFRPTRLKGAENSRLFVGVPTRLCKKRLTETYGDILRAVLQEVGIPDTQVEFLCSEPEATALSSILNVSNEYEKPKKIILHPLDKRMTIKMIQERVGEHYGVFPPDLKLRSGSKALLLPCRVAMYLAKQLTLASLPKIGREFGGKHPSTVLSAIQRIEVQRRTDSGLNRAIGELFDSMQSQVFQQGR
jgi:chromosomal replication initiation ATPase DnaA